MRIACKDNTVSFDGVPYIYLRKHTNECWGLHYCDSNKFITFMYDRIEAYQYAVLYYLRFHVKEFIHETKLECKIE